MILTFGDAAGTGTSPHAQRGRIGYMSHAAMLYDELTATENLGYFARLYRGQPCLDPAEALRSVGLDPALERARRQYSQGMRQRTSLARVLISQPELLLLDEPFSNMDVASAQQMISLLAQFRSERRTILLTTHQRELAEPLADYFLTLHAGQLVSTDKATNAAGGGHEDERARASWIRSASVRASREYEVDPEDLSAITVARKDRACRRSRCSKLC